MNKYLVTAAGLLAGALLLAVLHQADEMVAQSASVATSAQPAAGMTLPQLKPWVTSAEQSGNRGTPPDLSDSELDAWLPRLDSDAIASMSAARVNGDERTPPLSAPAVRVMPTAVELADEEQYQKYEVRQEKRVYRAFVEASKQKVAIIQSYIDQAEAGGISAEEVAFAEEKIRRIQAMAEQLQQDNPDLMSDEYQPQENWLPAAD